MAKEPDTVRHFRIPDRLWNAARRKAGWELRTVSDVVRELLEGWTQIPPEDAPTSQAQATTERADR